MIPSAFFARSDKTGILRQVSAWGRVFRLEHISIPNLALVRHFGASHDQFAEVPLIARSKVSNNPRKILPSVGLDIADPDGPE